MSVSDTGSTIREMIAWYGMSGWWDYDSGHRGSYHNMGMHLESIGRMDESPRRLQFPVAKTSTSSTPFWGMLSSSGIRSLPPVRHSSSRATQTTTPKSPRRFQDWPVTASTSIEPGLPPERHGKGGEIVGTSFRTQAQVTEDL